MSLGLDEEKAKERDAAQEVDANYGKLRIIWLAILAGLVAIYVVTRLVEPQIEGEAELVFWVLLVSAVGNLAVSFYLKQKLLRSAITQQNMNLVRSGYILAFALCEAVGLYGLISHFIAGSKYYYFFFVLSGFGVIVHKPQRDDLLAAANGAGGIWESRKQG